MKEDYSKWSRLALLKERKRLKKRLRKVNLEIKTVNLKIQKLKTEIQKLDINSNEMNDGQRRELIGKIVELQEVKQRLETNEEIPEEIPNQKNKEP